MRAQPDEDNELKARAEELKKQANASFAGKPVSSPVQLHAGSPRTYRPSALPVLPLTDRVPSINSARLQPRNGPWPHAQHLRHPCHVGLQPTSMPTPSCSTRRRLRCCPPPCTTPTARSPTPSWRTTARRWRTLLRRSAWTPSTSKCVALAAPLLHSRTLTAAENVCCTETPASLSSLLPEAAPRCPRSSEFRPSSDPRRQTGGRYRGVADTVFAAVGCGEEREVGAGLLGGLPHVRSKRRLDGSAGATTTVCPPRVTHPSIGVVSRASCCCLARH